jgi:hypothetical protein
MKKHSKIPAVAAGALGVGGAAYAAYIANAWFRYGQHPASESDPLLDQFMQVYEVEERHAARIEASMEMTFRAAQNIDFNDSAVSRLLFFIRTLPSRIRGHDIERGEKPEGFLAQTRSLGWGVLAEIPGRRIVLGAVTQPWKGEVVFRAVPPEKFAAFNEPKYVKIIWTLSVEPIGSDACLFHTETRVATTDAEARKLFRRYWSVFSPGVVLIRYASLGLIRKAVAQEKKRAA